MAATTFCLDGLFRRAGVLMLLKVDNNYVSALTRIENGHRPSDPEIAAGYDGDFVLKFLRSLVAWGFVHRSDEQFVFAAGLAKMLRRKRAGIRARQNQHPDHGGWVGDDG